MDRFKSTALIPDDDWANILNYSSFGQLTSSDDFGGWEFDPSDSKYDDFDDEDEDEDEESVTNFWKNESEAWRPEGIFLDPQEVASWMEDLPRQQHLHKLAEVQRRSALLAKVKETLDTVVGMADNSHHDTAAEKELLVACGGASGSAESDVPARKPKDREFINLQRLQDSESESDSDFDCFAEGKLMPASPPRIRGKMEIDVAVPGPSSAARPSPPQFENSQSVFLNHLWGMTGGLDERIEAPKFTTEVNERRVDGRTEPSVQDVVSCGEVGAPPAMPTMTGHKKKKKKKKKKKGGVSPSVAAPWTPLTSWTSVASCAPVSPTSSPIPMTSGSCAAQPTPGSASNGQRTWEPIVGREATQMFAAARAVPPPAAKKRKKSKGVARPQIPQSQMMRPPQTAAVSLTAAAGRENEFGRTMARAMSTVKVDELGINNIRPKRSVTGGLVLEIPGAKAHAKAAALTAALEKALRGTGVRLSCPQKYAELRIVGLTELATPKSVRKAVAAAGDCEKEDVTVGDLQRDSNGLFTAWARCPVRTAAKLAKDGQITVHPFVAKVVALAQRPLQCHRCLEFGHVQHRCTCTVDRSNLCYKCGGTSHKANGCLAAPRCPVCANLGVPANRRMGRPACNPPPKKMMTGKLRSGVALTQAIPAVLPPETPTSSRKRKKRVKKPFSHVRKSDVSPPSEPLEKRSKISTVARAPLLPTPEIFPMVAAASAAQRRAALKVSSPRVCPLANARTLMEMLGIALRQVPPGTSPSRTAAIITAAPEAEKLEVEDGGAVKPSALVVPKDVLSTVVAAAPSVNAAHDVSLSEAVADAVPGHVALQVSPQGVSLATNAKRTCDMLALRKEAPGTTVVITAALEPEKLGVEDGGCAIKSPPLEVQKDDAAKVARTVPAVEADSESPPAFHHCIPELVTRQCAEGALSTSSVDSAKP